MCSPLQKLITLNITQYNLLHLDFRLPLFDRGVVYPTGRHMCYGLFFNDYHTKSKIASMTSSDLFDAESELQYLSDKSIDDENISIIVNLVYLYKMYHYSERMVQNFYKLNELVSNRPFRIEHVGEGYNYDLFNYDVIERIEDYLIYIEDNKCTPLNVIIKDIDNSFNREQVWLLENGW